jgi:hypothetical protein
VRQAAVRHGESFYWRIDGDKSSRELRAVMWMKERPGLRRRVLTTDYADIADANPKIEDE